MLVAQALWLALPVILAAVAHMVVVKRDLLASLAFPIDGGLTVGGEPLFGANKTLRGFVVMPALGGFFGAAQGLALGPWAQASGVGLLAPLSGSLTLGYAACGAALGLGYVLGELPNSFAKRRLKIGPGQPGQRLWGPVFFVVDRCDSVVTSLLLGKLLFGYGWPLVAAGTACLSLVHLLVSSALYRLRIKRSV